MDRMQQPLAPVGGTPILPPSYLIVYFCFYLLLLSVLYVYVYRKKRPVLLWHKVRLFIVIAFVLKASLVAGGASLAAYWLVPPPSISKTIPQAQSGSFSPAQRIEIVFDRPVSRGSLEKSISPETPGRWVFENPLYLTHAYRALVFYPTYSLRQGTTYTVKLAEIRNLINTSHPYEYQFAFKTQASPKVAAISPVAGQRDVDRNTKITVTLDTPNNSMTEFDFQFTPHIEYKTTLDATKSVYTITPDAALAEGTEYTVKIQKSDSIRNLEDETIIERDIASLEYDGTFETKQSPGRQPAVSTTPTPEKKPLEVTLFTPENGWSAVNVHSPIKVALNQEVDHVSAEQKFSISPHVEGTFAWDKNTLIFTPQIPLSYTTSYTISLAKGIRLPAGLDSSEEFKSSFSTQNATTKLAVPAYLQKYTLSCEIASLRMAVNFRGANVTEDDLIPKVGFDTTPHNGNIWGNPYNAFVGNIKGTQMADGYGVYWGPIAKAARDYGEAQEFQGWSIGQLTGAIAANNPVIIWVYSHHGTRTSWKTPDGTDIYAVRDEHAVVVVGFVGPPGNPNQIIINDPLSGQVYWSRANFDRKWDIFGRSGVVVY